MKRIISVLLVIAVMFSLSACGEEHVEESKTMDYILTENTLQSDTEESVVSQPEEASDESAEDTASDNMVSLGERNLIVYFSRVGNTEYPEGIDASTSASIVIDKDTFGTTEYVARMIQESVGGDIHLIQTQESYTADFDELKDVNHEEMDTGFLPPHVEGNLDMGQYDTVFIGYPIWATDVPQAVLSFLDEYDLTGKTVVPFCTHDGYGAGGSYSTIREASHAAVSPDGLASVFDTLESREEITFSLAE